MAAPFAPAPHGTALSDCARRNPLEIPSQTQSVSAFLPGTVALGCATRGIMGVTFAHAVEAVRRPSLPPFHRRIALQAMPPLRRNSAANRKTESIALFSVLLPDGAREGDRCLGEGESSGRLPGRLNSQGFPKPVTASPLSQAPRNGSGTVSLPQASGLAHLVPPICQ